MNYYDQPTHIDFITTFKSKTRWNGYWFITWIIGPGKISSWRKTLDGQWILETETKMHSMDDIDIYPGRAIDYRGCVYAKGEAKERLDSILEKHMKRNGYAGEPYEYWKKYFDQIEASRQRFLRYKGKVAVAIPASQLPTGL